jgi:hypothetical protein
MLQMGSSSAVIGSRQEPGNRGEPRGWASTPDHLAAIHYQGGTNIVVREHGIAEGTSSGMNEVNALIWPNRSGLAS